MENIRNTQKKELVFQILDEMKGNNEKINADKVARKAQMGKQTILPYYNEWRFLADDAEAEEAYIPNDLIRSLKRLLIHWKHEISNELNAYKIQAQQESEDHLSIVTDLNNKNESISQKLAIAITDNDSLTGKLTVYQQQLQKKELDIKKQQIEDNNQNKIIAGLQSQIEAITQENTLTLLGQEKKIDKQYKQQIEHWMKALDDERHKTQEASKLLKLSQIEMLACKKEKGNLENQVEYKTQVYLDASRDRDKLQKQLNDQDQSIIIMTKIKLILDTEEDNLTAKIKALLLSERSYLENVDKIENKIKHIQKLEIQLKDMHLQKQSNQDLQLELERSRGFTLAMEQLTKNMEKK